MLGRLLRNVFGQDKLPVAGEQTPSAATVAAPRALAAGADEASAAYEALARGDYANALMRYEAMVRTNADDLDALVNLGLCHAALMHYAQAKKHLEAVIATA